MQAANRFVAIPFSEIATTKPAHLKLIAVLLEFADSAGKCWPSLRTIAGRAGEALSWVQRHLAEMEALGLFTRKRRRRGSFLYQLASRFLVFRQQDTHESPADRTELNPELKPKSAQARAEGDSQNLDKRRAEPPVPLDPKFIGHSPPCSCPICARWEAAGELKAQEATPPREIEQPRQAGLRSVETRSQIGDGGLALGEQPLEGNQLAAPGNGCGNGCANRWRTVQGVEGVERLRIDEPASSCAVGANCGQSAARDGAADA